MSFLGRVMKGRGSNVVFNKKYCGRDTTSLKFTGNETVKLLFKVYKIPILCLNFKLLMLNN